MLTAAERPLGGALRPMCAALALPLLLALGACAGTTGSRTVEQPNSVEAILGPVDLEDEMAPVEQSTPQEAVAVAEPEPTPAPAPAAGEDAAQKISFDGPDADPGVTDEVSAPPKRPNLPALELFGSGGRGGPGG